MSDDCYFFVELDESEKVSVLCTSCHDKHFPDTGWFWEGSVTGYGPWDYICRKCGQKVHEHKETEEDETNS